MTAAVNRTAQSTRPATRRSHNLFYLLLDGVERIPRHTTGPVARSAPGLISRTGVEAWRGCGHHPHGVDHGGAGERVVEAPERRTAISSALIRTTSTGETNVKAPAFTEISERQHEDSMKLIRRG